MKIENTDIGNFLTVRNTETNDTFEGQIVPGFGPRKNSVCVRFMELKGSKITTYMINFSVKTGKTCGKNNFHKEFIVC